MDRIKIKCNVITYILLTKKVSSFTSLATFLYYTLKLSTLSSIPVEAHFIKWQTETFETINFHFFLNPFVSAVAVSS